MLVLVIEIIWTKFWPRLSLWTNKWIKTIKVKIQYNEWIITKIQSFSKDLIKKSQYPCRKRFRIQALKKRLSALRNQYSNMLMSYLQFFQKACTKYNSFTCPRWKIAWNNWRWQDIQWRPSMTKIPILHRILRMFLLLLSSSKTWIAILAWNIKNAKK